MDEVTALRLIPLDEGERFRLLLRSGGADTPPVAVELGRDMAMGLLLELQRLQAKFGIPIPASLRRAKGRPDLRIVDDGEP